MAYQVETPEFSTFTAAADYSSNQYDAVDITAGATTVTLASVQGQKVIGFLQNDPTSGGVAVVQHFGIAKARAGAAVAIDDELIVNSSGRVIDAAGNPGFIIGRALEAASGNGEIITVLIQKRERSMFVFPLPIVLATVADGDVATAYTPGFRGRIIGVDFMVTNEVTTGSKATTLNLEIGTTNLTGGAVALTSANTATLGVIVAGSAVTAANTFSATDTISVEASSTTAFSEGEGVLLIKFLQD